MSGNSESRQLNILVAEDQENDYYFLTCILKKAPLVTLWRVRDGADAIKFLDGEGRYADRSRFPFPDIFLVDLNLPKIPGLKVLEWFKGHRLAGSVRIFVLSGSDSTENQAKALLAGAEQYFVKPLSLGHVAVIFSRPIAAHASAVDAIRGDLASIPGL